MKPIAAVRTCWLFCVLLFIAAAVGLRWGTQISIALMPQSHRLYVDPALLHGMWINRSILLFVLSAICGVLGIYFSLQASDVRQR